MKSFGVGSLLGFDIRIDTSWFVIVVLLLWSFSVAVFPAVVPEASPGDHLLMGAVATALFFASLLAHELAHAVVARRKGIPVDSITLFIFGGIARTRLEAETPGDEFAIAVVGPVCSGVLAGLFALLVEVGGDTGLHPAVAVAQQLVYLNVLLATFNLLPGFPLDGGRLLRAALWKGTGDLRRATRWACVGGRILGWLIIALGVAEALAGLVVGGLWLVFIGWFLGNAARGAWMRFEEREERSAAPEVSLVREGGHLVSADLTLRELVDWHVLRSRQEVFPVLREGAVVGLVTVEDIRRTPQEEWERTTVVSVMRPVRPRSEAAVALRRRIDPTEERFLRS